MTLYARGYRKYEDGFVARHLRFGPIFVEGYRGAVKTRAFRRFSLLFLLILIVYCMTYYLNPLAFSVRRMMEGGLVAAPSRAESLRATVSSYLGALDWLSPLLVLFVGSGLVADDLRTRALPLYLVRPITPTDYWLGKWLIPTGVLAVALLIPSLTLILFGVLLEPSDQVVEFAAKQGPVVLGVFGAYLAASLAYGGLVLLVSTLAGRRTPALVFGAAFVFMSPVLIGLGIGATGGPRGARSAGAWLDVIRSLALPNDVTVIFRWIARMPLDPHDEILLPPVGYAVAMVVLVFLLGAFVVLRRARTVEVVS